MKLLTYRSGSMWRAGLKQGDQILDIARASETAGVRLPPQPTALLALGEALWDHLRRLESRLDSLSEHLLAESALQLGPPVPAPGKILCVGLNYRKHAAESGMAEPQEPVLFSKFGNTVVGPNQPVAIDGLSQVDYESELALVISRRAKHVKEHNALAYVLGYLNANDVSERELQMRSGQWLLGKTLDGFLPLGPYLIAADAIGNPDALPVRGWLNGELRQDSNTSDMIFSVAEIIAYASRYMTLEPGDLICTGTPEGVILGREPKQWLRPSDVYEVEVGPLGRLRTPFSGHDGVHSAPTGQREQEIPKEQGELS